MKYRVDYFVNGKKFEAECDSFVDAVRVALNFKRCISSKVFVLTYDNGELVDIDYID